MSDSSQNEHLTPIPEELREQLADFQRHLWRIKIFEAVLAGIFGLILSFLVVFILERLFPIPAPARFLILLTGSSLAAIFAPFWIRRWVYGHKREEQLARLISKRFPKLGDRLLGIVELQDQEGTREVLSPALRQAAMIHVANQAAGRDMTEALPSSWHKNLAIGVGFGAAITMLGFVFSPKAGENAFKRWLLPFSDTEHYTFTQFDLEEIPSPYVVARGEVFTFEAPLMENSDERPETARARYDGQEWIEAELDQDGSYKFDFAGQQNKGTLTFEAGDAKHSITVEPKLRPEVEKFEAVVDLPSYLQIEPRKIDVRTGALTVLEGSWVVLKGTFSRDLETGEAQLVPEKPDENAVVESNEPIPAEDANDVEAAEAEKDKVEQLAQEEIDYSPKDLEVSIDGAELQTAPIMIDSNRAEIPFSWVDVDRLEGADTFTLRLEPIQDQVPATYISGIERNLVILEEETIEFEIAAEDDFGLKELGISWAGEPTKASGTKPANDSLMIQPGSPSMTRLSDRIVFSPQSYGIGPQKLQLSAYTEDYKPGRKRVYSEPITIYILTRDEHAQILKSQFDRVISELEDAARKELNNLDSNDRLDKLNSAEELQSEEARDKLAENQEKEAENAENLEEIAKKMEELFKDAARNGSLDDKTMKQMADAMKQMKELAETDLPEVEQKLGEAQDQKSTPEKAESDLKEAIEKQKEAVKKMQETIAKANEANENFEASTFVTRLKKAATEEDGISSALIAAFRGEDEAVLPILGAVPGTDSMDPIHARLIEELDKQQKLTTSDVRWIQEDLGRFHARTKKPIHKEIYDEMAAAVIDVKLENLRALINKNETYTSTKRAKKWSKTLTKWAEKLEGPKDEGGGGGDGGGGGGSPEDQDFEFMLKVMRMVQAEQDIRGRTRSLEQMLRSLKLSKPGN